MQSAGLAPDKKLYSLELEAFVTANDLQVQNHCYGCRHGKVLLSLCDSCSILVQRGLMSFRALKQQDGEVFQHVSDSVLGMLINRLR